MCKKRARKKKNNILRLMGSKDQLQNDWRLFFKKNQPLKCFLKQSSVSSFVTIPK